MGRSLSAAVLQQRLRRLGRRLGIEIGRYPAQYADRRRGDLLRRAGVNVVLDVGANEGQFAAALRGPGGYGGYIWSFEPGAEAFARLSEVSAADPLWQCRRLALMDRNGELRLHVAEGTNLSSFLASSKMGVAAMGAGIASRHEEVVCAARLDAVLDSLDVDPGSAFLKLDVQGSEGRVLDGAGGILERLLGVQLELPLVALYEEQVPAFTLVERLRQAGFQMVLVEPGYFDDASALMLEFDALFLREDIVTMLVAQRTRTSG